MAPLRRRRTGIVASPVSPPDEASGKRLLRTVGGSAVPGMPRTWWRLDDGQGKPPRPSCYTSDCGATLRKTGTRLWEMRDAHGHLLACAASDALHPTTISSSEWDVLGLSIVHVGLTGTSASQPIALEDLGWDFFTRRVVNFRIWFRDPSTGRAVHSGAKRGGPLHTPGRRYCHRCKVLISANNFVTQHLATVHKGCRSGCEEEDKEEEDEEEEAEEAWELLLLPPPEDEDPAYTLDAFRLCLLR